MSHADLTDGERLSLTIAAQARSELTQTEEAFDVVRSEMLEALAGTKLGEGELREQLYMGVNMLDRVRQALRMAVAAGDVAKHSGMMRAILEGRDPD
jgi:hypothetical protein